MSISTAYAPGYYSHNITTSQSHCKLEIWQLQQVTCGLVSIDVSQLLRIDLSLASSSTQVVFLITNRNSVSSCNINKPNAVNEHSYTVQVSPAALLHLCVCLTTLTIISIMYIQMEQMVDILQHTDITPL